MALLISNGFTQNNGAGQETVAGTKLAQLWWHGEQDSRSYVVKASDWLCPRPQGHPPVPAMKQRQVYAATSKAELHPTLTTTLGLQFQNSKSIQNWRAPHGYGSRKLWCHLHAWRVSIIGRPWLWACHIFGRPTTIKGLMPPLQGSQLTMQYASQTVRVVSSSRARCFSVAFCAQVLTYPHSKIGGFTQQMKRKTKKEPK